MEDSLITVLLINDNPSDTNLIRSLLSESSDVCSRVEAVERLYEGLDRLENGGIDVVLVDLGLPDSNGLDIFHRSYAHSPMLPIIVLTELDDATLAVQAVHQGAQDYLVKGAFEKGVLERSVRYAIERKRTERELQKAKEDDRVVLRTSVSDTGMGIADEKREAVFRAFEQVDGSMSRRHGGAGLGLATCRRLVDLMGGRIWFESEVGKGSTFHFTACFSLPDAERAQSNGAGDKSSGFVGVSRADVARVPKSTCRLKVLLAEDSYVNQKLVIGLLTKQGHDVTVAGNGKEAVDLTRGDDFDVVLMDVQMPEMDGFEATGRIRDREKRVGGHVPIVALTAHAMQGDRERCIEAGMDEYVSKPIRARELHDAIQRVTMDSDEGTAEGPLAVPNPGGVSHAVQS